MGDKELNSQIADELSDAAGAMYNAYHVAKDAWGENDSRTKAINSAWSEVDTVLRQFDVTEK